ncbi:hypothetical protein L228DRAFT_242605 [Xylona heveae TC161]|uniref:Ribophorin II C-terminal domain-containing protein n=1 Tax=Xylona heveae (strain CBS 132557 / TC161) TaxID=1328760 RepID=A0A165JFU4_XYLHT|nr:hypothetical protein L228DRAFT_242605 [Xylona heveae TC161]KZF26179.1 hypothetical protein L228DRAFT_242605 [Xylona heveae TC161]
MRFVTALLPSLLLAGATGALGASWSFDEGTITVQTKGAGVGGGYKDKLSPSTTLSQPINLGPSDNLKILLTAKEGSSTQRPHQAFLQVGDADNGLSISYALNVRDSGKAKLELSQKDIPAQLIASSKPLHATLLLGSWGTSTPYSKQLFDLNVLKDPKTPIAGAQKPLRYGALEEIHHIFRGDPKSPPIIITAVFTLVVAAILPVLFGAWIFLGANLNHLSRALSNAPVSHSLFYSSIVALEGIFFLYYTSWTLFQTLPAVVAVGFVTFLSGSRALSEVQARRLDGLR